MLRIVGLETFHVLTHAMAVWCSLQCIPPLSTKMCKSSVMSNPKNLQWRQQRTFSNHDVAEEVYASKSKWWETKTTFCTSSYLVMTCAMVLDLLPLHMTWRLHNELADDWFPYYERFCMVNFFIISREVYRSFSFKHIIAVNSLREFHSPTCPGKESSSAWPSASTQDHSTGSLFPHSPNNLDFWESYTLLFKSVN